MIALIIKSYLTILLSIGLGAFFVFVLGLYWIIKKVPSSTKTTNVSRHDDFVVTDTGLEHESYDYSVIAGDDVIATQLDLARAYIETGKSYLAKNILESVIKQGSDAQQKEAQYLLGCI